MSPSALQTDPQTLAATVARNAKPDADHSITLLAPTQAGPTISSTDRRVLDELAAAALDRLAGDIPEDELVVLRAQLAIAIESAGVGGTDLGVAVLVGHDRAESVTLPFSPRRRILIDDSDRHGREAPWVRWPRHRVLVLSATWFRILEGRRGALAERPVDPPEAGLVPVRAMRRRRARPERWALRDQRAAATVHAASRAIARLDAADHLPLVVVGPARWIRLFTERAGDDCEVVATVVGNRIDDPAAGLATLVAPELDRFDGRQAMVLAAMEHADRDGRLRWGLGEAWRAAITGEIERLWVADDHIPATEMADDGTRITIAGAQGCGQVDDLLGELFEMVALSGGVAVQVSSATFADMPAPAAVQSRPRRSAATLHAKHMAWLR